jgi:hypothetical protein
MIVRMDMLNGHEICHGGFIFTPPTAFRLRVQQLQSQYCRVRLRDRVHGAGAAATLTARAQERQLAGRTGVYDVGSRTSAARPSRCSRQELSDWVNRSTNAWITRAAGRRVGAARDSEEEARSCPSHPSQLNWIGRNGEPRRARGCSSSASAVARACVMIRCHHRHKPMPRRPPARPQVACRPREVVHDEAGPARKLPFSSVRGASGKVVDPCIVGHDRQAHGRRYTAKIR